MLGSTKFFQQDSQTSQTNTKTFEQQLDNYYNVQYYGQLYLGSQLSPLTVIFDTGSSWLWVPTTECAKCHQANKFDNKASLTYKKMSQVPQHVQYGGGSVWGYHSQDQVCLDKSNSKQCLTNYNLITVDVTTEMEGLQADGILGLSPSRQFSQSDIFVDRLYKEGIINKRMFSFTLGGSDEDSKVIFGGYDSKYMRANQSISWINLIDDTYWTVRINGAKFGNYEFKLDTNQAIIDSGTSYILMPQNDFAEFRSQIEPGRTCNIDYGKSNLLYCNCYTESYSDFPNLDIKIGDQFYSIPSTSYMNRKAFKCYFKIQAQGFGTRGYWILGDVFMLNYYSIFDLENKRVGLVSSIHVDRVNYWYDILYVASILLAVFGFVSFIISCYQERKEKQQERMAANQVMESEMRENPSQSRYSAVQLQDLRLETSSINNV